MRMLYIVGLGRSGSTLVDTLLDSHSRVRSPGGIRRLAKYARWRPCPCGAPRFADCEFWSRVDTALHARIGRSLTTVEVHSRDASVFRAHNRAVLEAVAEATGVDTVVDNSKSAGRLRRLMKESDLEVIPVHVMRHPHGRARSLRKRDARGYAGTLTYTWRSLRIFALLYRKPHIVVDYDALAADPEGQLTRLMERLGLAFEQGQLHWAERPHHNIGAADVLRTTPGSRIRPDNASGKDMPRHARWIVNALAFPGRIVNRLEAKRWGL